MGASADSPAVAPRAMAHEEDGCDADRCGSFLPSISPPYPTYEEEEEEEEDANGDETQRRIAGRHALRAEPEPRTERHGTGPDDAQPCSIAERKTKATSARRGSFSGGMRRDR
mmetsp:Transcript_16783/g.41323  ORF Transcript_16783/g.41323 Transcript_16783/m.41323 type:complete len:113 (-) Transcript_16783:92-430(-)